MDEKLRITIVIAGKRFSLVVPSKDEEKYRKAAEQLNKKISEYAQRSPDADESYIMAQAAFFMSLRLLFLNEAHSYEMKRLAEICSEVEALLPSSED